MHATAKKFKNIGRSKNFVVAAVIVLLVILFAYLFRGWIRITLLPRSASVMFSGQVHSTFNDETAKLSDPLSKLGYKNVTTDNQGCKMIIASRFHELIGCSFQASAYSRLSDLSVSPDGFKTYAATLMAALQKEGWSGTYTNDGPYTSLGKLADSLAAGIDYQPNASYTKSVGKVSCIFESHTAFSKPFPPAVGSEISCVRVLMVFGNPYADIQNNPANSQSQGKP